ncbi:MAG: hypothetical protein Q607_CBUC00038G0002 [Clostridium butyricum DORA_1]|nr:MAG: hypothetical protein Q607_CBUC00038G0002 [Clostridium butyricum DORA_1]MDU1509962.1 hypothetical protein [Clostridium butyricum]
MERYIKITIDLKETKLSWNQLYKLYNVDEYNEPQDMMIGGNTIELTFYKKPSEISMIGKYI